MILPQSRHMRNCTHHVAWVVPRAASAAHLLGAVEHALKGVHLEMLYELLGARTICVLSVGL
jgi:hypothetical protein